MKKNRTVDLLIADDHPMFRTALRQALETQCNNWRVREAADGEQALELCASSEPHVAILDLDMPKLDGFATLRMLKCRHPSVHVILLTMYDDEALVGEAMRLGAMAYLPKDDGIPDCLRAIGRVVGAES
jgi:DNA-binding NarL/FixJ family response regulator